jgi:hypothetical protein
MYSVGAEPVLKMHSLHLRHLGPPRGEKLARDYNLKLIK